MNHIKENYKYSISPERLIKVIDKLDELEKALKYNNCWNEYLWREIITIQCLLMYDDNDNSIYDDIIRK